MEAPRNVAYLVGLIPAVLRAIVENVTGYGGFAVKAGRQRAGLRTPDERHVASGIPACSNQRTRQPRVPHAHME